MTARKKYFFIVFLAVITFFYAGCIGQPKPDETPVAFTPTVFRAITPIPTPTPAFVIGDGGLLSNEPCGPPCFLGIEPGKTTRMDVLDILTTKGIIDTCETIDQYQFAIDEGIGGWGCPSFGSINFRKVTGIVSVVVFEIIPPIELQEIMVKHGSPDAVWVVNLGTPEAPLLSASIFYFDLRAILLFSKDQDELEYKISPTAVIDGVIYGDDQYLKENLDRFNAWKGYGNYKP